MRVWLAVVGLGLFACNYPPPRAGQSPAAAGAAAPAQPAAAPPSQSPDQTPPTAAGQPPPNASATEPSAVGSSANACEVLSEYPERLEWTERAYNPLNRDIVTCEFRATAHATAPEGRPHIKADSDPTTITFANLRSATPTLKGNAGESPLTVAGRSEKQVVLLERNDFGNIFTYTLFFDTKLAVWTKAYDMSGKPYGLVSIGRCY